MNVALITILGVALAALLAQVQWGLTQITHRIDKLEGRLDRRLEAIDDRLLNLEVKVTQIGTRLDDHITDHPGPSDRVLRP